jgi:copper chaperone
MERNLKLLMAFCAAGLIGLAFFASAINPASPARAAQIQAGSASLDSAGQTPTTRADDAGIENSGPQVVQVRAMSTGAYDQQELHVKAGVPVRFEFSADGGAGCGKMLVMPDFNVRLVSSNGESQSAEFTPQKGVYAYHCGMNMFRGKLYADWRPNNNRKRRCKWIGIRHDVGKRVEALKKTFKVTGMHCESCNWIIRENVSEVKGVKSAKPDYRTGEVVVEYEAPADDGQIKAAICREGGYKVV